MYLNSITGWSVEDRRSKFFIFRIICTLRKDAVFLFSFSTLNGMLTYRPFRKIEASECSSEVNKAKISSTYRR